MSVERARRPTAATLLSVAELARRIQGALETELDPVWVVGEISNLRAAASGHYYFTLKDAEAQVSAALFRSAAARLRFAPRDGLEVIAGGRIGFYGVGGRLQLYVDSLEPRGLGALRLRLEQLRERLSAEGLLAAERKRSLPYLPRCVGVVTALGGAAIHDILATLRERFPNLRVVIRPVRVQGLGAEREIADGITDLAALPGVDVLIVGRGGGSIEDLWAFNDEGVARAIIAAAVPVVSAVGHEIDVTIADLVADARAATPTAAAALVVPRKVDLVADLVERRRSLITVFGRRLGEHRRTIAAMRSRLRDPRRDLASARARAGAMAVRLERALARAIVAARTTTDGLGDRLRLASPERGIALRRGLLAELLPRLATFLRHRTVLARERLGGLSGELSSLSPLAVLERGYSVVWQEGSNRPLRDSSVVGAGDLLSVRLARGRLRARVTQSEPPAKDDADEPN